MINYNTKLLENKGHLYVACSGGVDSVAITHFLAKVNPDVSIFHFNHKLRPQNDRMLEATAALSGTLKSFRSYFASALEIPIDESKGLEAGAREARLKALSTIPLVDGERHRVVVAHHLDDCVESYLMNCFNGKTDGYVIPPISNFPRFALYRPFLLTPKSELRAYVERNGLMKYVVEDETNTDTTYRRNFIRNKVIPTLQPHYPGLRKVVMEKVKKDYDKVNGT
jgi:tRNA(Ile)-lysidine synthase